MRRVNQVGLSRQESAAVRTMYCSTCSTSFDLEVEGMAGDFGIIPVAFCATCRVCVKDLAEQQWDLVPRPDDYEEELPW